MEHFWASDSLGPDPQAETVLDMFEKGSNLAKLWQVQILARISTLVVCFRSDFSMMVAYRLSERLTLDRVRGSIMFQ